MFASPDRLLIWLSVAAYAGAVIYVLYHLLHVQRHRHSVTYPVLAVGFILQTAGLYLRGMEIGACPLGNTFEIVQFTTWSMIFLFLVIGPVFQVNLLGFSSALLAAALGAASLVLPGWDAPHNRTLFGGNPLIEFHAAVSIFGYGIFGLLAVVSLMYWIQYGALTRKKSSRLFSFLPSIVQLDALSSRLLHAGLLLLTIAFASGILVWFEDAWDQLHTKLISVFLLWIGYGMVWLLRLWGRLSPQKAATAFVVLYVFAMASIWPINLSHSSPGEPNPIQQAAPIASTPQ